MVDIKISVITVVYNAVGTIERTIKSVLCQSYRNIEYIIIDGGSTDGTLDIIDRYHSNIAYFISEPDGGIYDAMNKGIKQATGHTVGFLNADDWYEQTAIETVAQEYRQTSAHIIAGNALVIYKDGRRPIFYHKPPAEMWKGTLACHQAVFISKKAFEMYGVYDTHYKLSADYELFMRMYTRGAKITLLNNVLANFNVKDNLSDFYIESAEENNRVIQKYKEYYPGKQKEISNLCEERYKAARIGYCGEKRLDVLLSAFNRLWDARQQGLVIWGTGVWGKKTVRFLNLGNISFDFFVDSDEQKQGTKLFGKDIMAPEALEGYDGTIFIAVRNHDGKIVEKLESLNNRNLRWISLCDFMDAVVEQYDALSIKR